LHDQMDHDLPAQCILWVIKKWKCKWGAYRFWCWNV